MLRSRRRKYKEQMLKIISWVIIAFLAFGSIKIGLYVGDRLFYSNEDIIKKTDTHYFKNILNFSLPLIDLVYNSGNISISFEGEIRKVINGIFGFDITTPATILNSNSVFLSSYYSTYQAEQLKLAQHNNDSESTSKEDNTNHNSIIEDSRGIGEETKEVKPDSNGATPNPSATPDPLKPDNDKDPKPGQTPANNTPNVVSSGKITVLQIENTNFKIDIDTLIKEPLRLGLSKSGPKVLIYHTHTTEGYLKSISDLNKKDFPARTNDPKYNVLAVGESLTRNLKQYGFGVIHNGTNHLALGDIGAYSRSLDTMNSIIKGNPSVGITFDIHRDGYGEGNKLRSVTKINGKNAARLMFVVGSNKNLEHPNWKENLKLALKLQKYMEENYPGLMREVYISENRYNEHVTKGSLIVEVGGDGNTIDEAEESMKYLAKAVSEVVK